MDDAEANSEIVSETLTRLTQHACEHFRDEECVFEEIGYPLLEEHRNEHQQFQEKVVQCCLAASIGVRSVPRELLDYLYHWLTHHLLEQDMKCKPFFAAYKAK